MSSLQLLLTQFRARYPIGSLLSEFLTVHDGRFVVRALVQMGGVTLATGLAIAPDLEQAEDRAKVRALEALGLGSAQPLETEPITSLPPFRSDSASFDSAAVLASPAIPALESTSLPPYLSPSAIDSSNAAPRDFSTSADGFTGDVLTTAETSPTRIVADLYTHIAEGDLEGNGVDTAEESVDLSKIVTPASQLLGKTPRRKANSEENPEPLPSNLEPVSAPASVDFSDVLMETDVELRRLGWDSKKGREHLKRTYSKRSRQELSETELYDFLDYLKTQPTLGQTPF